MVMSSLVDQASSKIEVVYDTLTKLTPQSQEDRGKLIKVLGELEDIFELLKDIRRQDR